MDVLNSTPLQTVLYLVFVVLFQALAGTMRMREEYFVNKHVMDRLVTSHFDASHNTFESIRRVADIYEWGNMVLWPGLFGDLGPCHSNVGSRSVGKGCVDEAWPDGDGTFSLDDATPYDVEQLVERMDLFDFTDGIMLKQARAAPRQCKTTQQLGPCLPELEFGDTGSTESFGRNYTHPSLAPAHPYHHFTSEELGSDPDGVTSAAVPSMKTYGSDGFVAIVIPFFSDTFLPEQQGMASEIVDYRLHFVNTTNGRRARYYCVRLSSNGHHIRQLCDPGTGGNGNGALTGAVRLAVEEMWNDLKRGHFLDARTRLLTLTLQIRSNHVGVRYRLTLMLELTALGAILPSYDVETRIIDSHQQAFMYTLADVSLAMVILFSLLEGVELAKSGASEYFSDMWNVMDWANFILFFATWVQIRLAVHAAEMATPEHQPCTSSLCVEVGFFDDWRVMGAFRHAKLLLSLCVCIQLLKVLKFAAQMVPKMSLATAVLKKCMMDLVFFGISFMISVFAFSAMLSVQLGPVMHNYMDQVPAFISLFRALFGDFDIEDILDNSRGYTNALLFLAYLFIAIFIMLSMFLAILAEAQIAVREDEAQVRSEQEASGAEWDEYGIVSMAVRACRRRLVAPVRACFVGADAVSSPTTGTDSPKPGPGTPRAMATSCALDVTSSVASIGHSLNGGDDALLTAIQGMQDEFRALNQKVDRLAARTQQHTYSFAPLEGSPNGGIMHPVPQRPRGLSPLGFDVSPSPARDIMFRRDTSGRTPSPVRKARSRAMNWAFAASLKLQA